MPKVLLEGYQCYRCKHKWRPRKFESKNLPKVCPNCKSAYWNTPKVRFLDKVKE